MFIETETTPNPATLKFLPGRPVLPEGTLDIRDPQSAAKSPLAQALFGVPGVAGVFFGSDFISVTKADGDWREIKPAVLGTIMEHFVSGKPIVLNKENAVQNASAADEPEIVKQIKELIETRVRPAVAQDGGDIVYRDFKDGIVQLELHGSCSGCPSSTITLKNGIENMLKHYVPEVVAVEAVA